MLKPAQIDIAADRWVACTRTIAFVGLDLLDAEFAAQVRTVPDVGGTALVSLITVLSAAAEGVHLSYSGTATVAAHIAAGRLVGVPPGYETTDSVAVSLVGVRINETTMEGLPFPDDVGDNITFAWDMHITPDGGLKDKYVGGTFIVRAGVTQ